MVHTLPLRSQEMPDTTTQEVSTAPAQDTLDAHQLWLDAVQSVAGKAYEKLPELKDNIALAYNLVVEGHVQHVHGHGYQVATGLAKGRKFWQVGERCDCPDAALMPQGLCAHKLATMLHIRAKQLLIDHAAGTHAQPADLTTPDVPEESKEEVLGLRIPEKYIVDIQG